MINLHVLAIGLGAALIACQSCRTTSPRATGLLQDAKAPPGTAVSSAVSPEASPANSPAIIPATEAPAGTVIRTSGAPVGSANEFRPVLLEWVVVTASNTGSSSGALTWDIDLRSTMEIWCERQCSEFKLDEVTKDGVTALSALKKTIQGNVNPGILNVHKQFRGSRDTVHKIHIANVGVMGQSLLLEDVLSEANSNFYAVPMQISKPLNPLQDTLIGEFSGKKVEIQMKSNTELPVLVQGAPPTSAFVMGTLVTGSAKSSSGHPTQIFLASKIIVPWSEN
jgi:hypothetical protein